MRTRSPLPPILTRGIIRSVWLLKATPSAGAGAAVQVPTQCVFSLMAFDASLYQLALIGNYFSAPTVGNAPSDAAEGARGSAESAPLQGPWRNWQRSRPDMRGRAPEAARRAWRHRRCAAEFADQG